MYLLIPSTPAQNKKKIKIKRARGQEDRQPLLKESKQKEEREGTTEREQKQETGLVEEP